MSTFLFDSLIFGPVWSRRLGESLGINLLPANRKTCNFNCVYCECGLTPKPPSGGVRGFPSRSLVEQELRAKLSGMRYEGKYLDSITFAGNGEPTLHPLFPAILDDVIRLRDEFYPACHVSVLSNATMIESEDVFKALLKADINILKLDSAKEETLRKINCPPSGFSLSGLLKNLKLFNGMLTIQTLFFRGVHNGERIDNSTEEEIKAWIEALKVIKPGNVMIYTLARDTAVGGLEILSPEELKTIALQVEKEGISTQVSS